jgi:hypothetical protein
MSKEYIEINKDTFPKPYRDTKNGFMKGWNACLNAVLYHKTIVTEIETPVGGLTGWICPVCGRGLSPYTSSCPCAINREITYGTGTAVPQFGTVTCQDGGNK